jgi:hypothetical protein
LTLSLPARYFSKRDTFRRGSQVGKAEVCKTFMHRFDSGPRLHPLNPFGETLSSSSTQPKSM